MAWGGRQYNSNSGGGNTQGNSNQGGSAPQGGDNSGGSGNGGGNNRGGFQKRNSGGNQGGGFQRKNQGQGRKFGRSQGGDDNFEFLTGLFQSKSGNAFTVFLTPEILEALATLQEGDLLGVNQQQKDQTRFSLWVKRADGSGQGGDQGQQDQG